VNDDLDAVKAYLEQWFPQFGYQPRDDLFLACLRAEFPRVDLLEQIKTFHAWCLDRQDGKPLNYRLTLRKWLRNSRPRT
jgi:hypothetical protein